jgi:hypothetical protein
MKTNQVVLLMQVYCICQVSSPSSLSPVMRHSIWTLAISSKCTDLYHSDAVVIYKHVWYFFLVQKMSEVEWIWIFWRSATFDGSGSCD